MIPDDLPALLYTVAPGDTIYKLAKEYNTTIDDILHANPFVNANSLSVGTILTLFPRS